MRYAFIAAHRPVFPVRAMCHCLGIHPGGIHPSGFYAWRRHPLSKRAREDARQTELIRKACKDSGKVYGYRKLHNDLLDQGEACRPNHVARLAGLAGIKAQGKVLIHSDQGSQFTSMDWAWFLKHHNLEHSMSRRGNCHDNAVAESFFNLLKRERIRRRTYKTRADARQDVFDYIEMF